MTIYLKDKHTLQVDDFRFKCSIGKNGLSKPIVVKEKDGKFEMTFGGNRLQVAAISGFTHIDAIAVRTDEEVKRLHDLMTQLPPHEGKSITHGGKHP